MNKRSAMINIVLLGGLPFIGLLAAIILPNLMQSWNSLLLSSLILIIIGKVSQFRKGRWIGFGSSDMDKPFKYFYLLGWFLLINAILIGLAVTTNA
ncbi:MAG: hypothetical protein AAF431_04775 [Pseudomonadota bacterium]